MDIGFDIDEQVEKLAKIPKAVRLSVVAGLLVAVGAGWYMTSYQDKATRVTQLRAESQDLQRKLNKVRVVANNLGEFEQEVADLERDLEGALKQLPNRKQFEDLLRDITTAGKKVGVDLKSIARAEELNHDFYVEVPFTVELEGGYHDVAGFFERVSRLPRIVNIGSLVIKSDSTRGGEETLLKVEGTATTFRFVGTEETALASAAAGDQA